MLFKKINNKYIKKILFNGNKNVFLTTIFLGVFGDIFFLSGSSDSFIFGILGVSLMTIYFYKLSSRIIFIFCLLLLGVMFVQFVVGNTSAVTEKTAVWWFLFTVIGIFRQWTEITQQNHNKIS